MPRVVTLHLPSPWPVDDVVPLPDAEARHAARVLRLRPGDAVDLVDGEGHRGVMRLARVDRKGVDGRIESASFEPRRLGVDIELAAGLIRNTGRYEFMLEKAAEVGVRRIVPVVAGRSEARGLRRERAEHILVSAMKQSGSAYVTELDEVISLEAYLARPIEGGTGIICHEGTDLGKTLREHVPRGGPVRLLIGPEGGFEDQEVVAAVAAGWKAVSLGAKRLRAETAALVAASFVALMRG